MQSSKKQVENLVRNLGRFSWNLSSAEMKKIKLGDTVTVYGVDYIVTKWYYYYVTLKPIPKIRRIVQLFRAVKNYFYK